MFPTITVLSLVVLTIAQVEVAAMAQYGVLGAVLAWFMLRVERLLIGVRHEILNMNKTMLIWLLEAPTTSHRSKRLCHGALKKLDPEMASEAHVKGGQDNES